MNGLTFSQILANEEKATTEADSSYTGLIMESATEIEIN